MKNKLLEIITRHLAPPARLAALLLATLAATSAWAAPYETTGYEAFGSTDGVVLWRAKSTEESFHASTVINVAADGTEGTEYQMKVYNANPTQATQTTDKTIAWQRFASNQTSVYAAPGKVLVYDEAGCRERSNAQFAPLSFGGLYVKALAAEGTPYTIMDDKSDTTDRKVELGASDFSTVFKFEKSFTFDRNSATEVKGTATVDIDSGATFTINARANKGAKVDSGNTLILKGSGTLAVTGGLTVGGTLDISNSPSSISGDVTLSAGSTIVLPAGTAMNSTVNISVCSGTLAVSGAVNVKIGTDSAVSADLVVSGGAITSILTERTYSATVSGAKNFSAISWEMAGVASDGVFSSLASAEITVGEASTITIDSATTMATLKLLGSADLTIVTSSQLTAAALNLSEYTGSVTIEGTAFTLANGGLTGAATFILDPGEGNTYTMSSNNTGYTGEAIIKSGTVKMGDAQSFGSVGRTSSIRVKGGAALDANNSSSGRYGSDKNKVILEESAKFYTSISQSDYKQSAFTRLTLEGDAIVDASAGNFAISQHYNYDYTQIALGDYTLTKTGNNEFFLSAVQITGSGVFDVRNGAIVITSSYFNTRPSQMLNGTLRVAEGAYLKFNDYTGSAAGGGVLTVKNLELNGTVTRASATYSTLTVTGSVSGTGTTPMLTLAAGATLKPKSATGGLTVTESLTFNGAVNVDLSDVNLANQAEGTYFAILTAPRSSAFDLANVTLSPGANGHAWVLYSRETSEGSGIYELGVYLTPDVTWRGASGTWSDTSFNGGTDNYTTGQQVVFSDDGESSATPLAVTVSGQKTVSALDFIAASRDVTLSGDVISAGTVTKIGSGVATINSALSVNTSISVNDGVLVINPTDAVVSDAGELADGTLVVYVGSGDTTTISAAISATRIIKRGAGTLVLSSGSNSISDRIIVRGGTLKASSNVNCFGGSDIPVYVEDGGAVDMNNVRFLNRVYIIGDGPDGNGAYINTGDPKDGAHSGGMQGNINNKLTLTGDASIGGDSTIHFGSSSSVDIGTYTLTKKGVFWLPLNGTTISGTGKIVIAQGDFSNNGGENILSGIDLEITDGTLDMASGTSMSIKNFKCATAITANATVANSAKLIVNGKITANGMLTIPNLQLNDGASIELATAASYVKVSGAFTFASGNVELGFADGVSPTSATFLDLSALNLSEQPAGNFTLASDAAEIYVPSKSATSVTATKGLASITINGITTPYANALALAQNLTATYDYVTVLGTGDVSLYWVDGLKVKNPNGATLSFIGLKEDCAATASTVGDITTYTKAATATTYTWTGNAVTYDDPLTPVSDPRWSSAGNWSFVNSGSATETASRCPQAGDTVIFNDGAAVNHATAVTVAGIEVNGNVTVSGTSSLETSGNVTGSGTLNITGGGIASAATGLTVLPNVVFGSGTYIACGTGGGTITFNGNVSLPSAGTVSLWNAGHTFAGTTTFNGTFNNGGNQTLTLGEVTVAANTTLSGRISFGGAISIGSGITLTTPASNVSFSGASLVGSGTLSLGATLSEALTLASWTGTVVLPAVTSAPSDGFRFDWYGKSGSTVKIDNGFSGWLNASVADSYQVKPRLVINSAFTITGNNGSLWYNFAEISGTGTVTLNQSNNTYGFHILHLVDFSGKVNNNKTHDGTLTPFTVEKITLNSAPVAGQLLVESDTPDNIALSIDGVHGVYVGDTKQDIIIGKKSDGIHVAATKSTETVDNETVTVLDTGSNTAVDASSLSGKVAIPGTVTQISGIEAANLLLKVTYTPDGGDSTTGYYAGILTLDDSGNVSLDPSGTVTIAEETVKVQPETAEDSPMTFTGSSPSFTVKTIPGLWYQVVTGTSMSGTELAGTKEAGTAVQATTTTVSPTSPSFSGTVKYYKIAVGASQAALQ